MVLTAALAGVIQGLTSAGAQTVKFSDLDGSVVEVDIIYDRKFRRDGQVRNNENHTNIKLVVGPGETLQQSHTITIIARDKRVISTRTFKLALELNKAFKTRDGHLVWAFEEDKGRLTRLQTLVSGGRRISIDLARAKDGLSCKAEAAFAREDGTGEIEASSIVREGTIEWLDVRQVSTKCRVTKS